MEHNQSRAQIRATHQSEPRTNQSRARSKRTIPGGNNVNSGVANVFDNNIADHHRGVQFDPFEAVQAVGNEVFGDGVFSFHRAPSQAASEDRDSGGHNTPWVGALQFGIGDPPFAGGTGNMIHFPALQGDAKRTPHRAVDTGDFMDYFLHNTFFFRFLEVFFCYGSGMSVGDAVIFGYISIKLATISDPLMYLSNALANHFEKRCRFFYSFTIIKCSVLFPYIRVCENKSFLKNGINQIPFPTRGVLLHQLANSPKA